MADQEGKQGVALSAVVVKCHATKVRTETTILVRQTRYKAKLAGFYTLIATDIHLLIDYLKG